MLTQIGGVGQAPPMEKRCPRCDVLKPVGAYTPIKGTNPLRYASHCKACKTAQITRMRALRRQAQPPKKRGRARQDFRARFEAKVRRISADGCWEWTAYRDRCGYGMIGRPGGKGAPLRAHRVAYELYVGPIPPGAVLDHLCEAPWCVNPDHLEPVTNTENLRRSAWKRGLA